MKTRIIKLNLLTAILVAFTFLSIFGQDIQTTTFNYTKTGSGSIGEEDFSVSLTNYRFTIKDLDYNKIDIYGPVVLIESGFEYDLYYETYGADIDQDPIKFKNNLRSYKCVFDKKGGNLIILIEAKLRPNNSKLIKLYYTEKGKSMLH